MKPSLLEVSAEVHHYKPKWSVGNMCLHLAVDKNSKPRMKPDTVLNAEIATCAMSLHSNKSRGTIFLYPLESPAAGCHISIQHDVSQNTSVFSVSVTAHFPL